ncbi:hypothetical protein [Kitasatospora sp. LaBMicrA B282]|uniref:hypothetical protein n=1 Tax=Kitasatospora sp. LaBMicrA B282 TaxID=3420949 RepID=UPI003D13CEAC
MRSKCVRPLAKLTNDLAPPLCTPCVAAMRRPAREQSYAAWSSGPERPASATGSTRPR